MPLGRNARQRQQRPARKTGAAWTPRIDVFGTLRMPDGSESRARLIEYAPLHFAAFTKDAVQTPLLFATQGDFSIKGRIMTAAVEDSGAEVKFQKAGCGCETPHELRAGRSVLLRAVPIAEAETEEPAPDTVHELQMQNVPRQV